MTLLDRVRKNRRLRYVDLGGKIEATAQDLTHAYGNVPKRPKRLAFLYIDSSASAVAAIWSFLAAGHTVALLNHQLHTSFRESLEGRYHPWFIVDQTRPAILGYEFVRAEHDRGYFRIIDEEMVDYEPSADVDVLLGTSGTTGSPKFVKLSQENLLQNALSIIDYLPIQASDITPLNLPLSYSYGLSLLTTNSMAGGTVICSPPNPLAPAFWEEFRSLGFTTLSGTPDLYEYLRSIGFLDWQLPSLRYLTQAGGKLNANVVSEFAAYAQARNIRFFVMYGQTEATARMSFLDPSLTVANPSSIGRPIKNGRFVIDSDTSELVYQGPNVFGGYAQDRHSLSVYQSTGELRTGDLARKDQQGLYYITGRLNRMCKILGVRMNLDELEQLLRTHFGGTRFYCVELNAKILVATASRETNEDEVADYFSEVLNMPRSALHFLHVTSIPKNANGKTNYAALAASARNETSVPSK